MDYAATRAKNIILPIAVMAACALLGYNIALHSFAAEPPATGIGVSTNQSQYTVGQDVIITLSNSTSADVYVKNNCPNEPLSVYQLENNQWVSLSEAASASKCVGEPPDYVIPADRSIKTDYRYWPDLFKTPGTYKIVANIESHSQGPSTEFQVVN